MAITLDPSISMNSTSNVYADAQVAAADKLSSQIQTATSDDDMLQACKDFESYMLEQIYKNMEKTTKLFSDDEEEGDSTSKMYLENFKDNYYQDLMQKMMSAGQGVGIAEQLYQSITNQKLGISADTTLTEEQAQALSDAAKKTTESSEATPQQTAEELVGAAGVAAASTIAASTM
ncbi:MAG: rod-binding protein [Eubacterium sp.]|nr:rod-binding protein [Eubacterium sp.]